MTLEGEKAPVDASEKIFQFLDTNGDGSGTIAATGDYSSVADEFYFQPTVYAEIHRLIICIEDTAVMQAGEYGNLGAALTNGYELQVLTTADALVADLTGGETINTNAGIGRSCYDVDIKSWGAGNEILLARWSFDKSGYPLYLTPSQRLSIVFNDNLTGLISHTFMIQGEYK